jgi:hypothetical protein
MCILLHMATFHHIKDIITLKNAYVLFIRSVCIIYMDVYHSIV